MIAFVTQIFVGRWMDIYMEFQRDTPHMKFERHLGNAAAELSVKFQSNRNGLTPNLTAWILHEILW